MYIIRFSGRHIMRSLFHWQMLISKSNLSRYMLKGITLSSVVPITNGRKWALLMVGLGIDISFFFPIIVKIWEKKECTGFSREWAWPSCSRRKWYLSDIKLKALKQHFAKVKSHKLKDELKDLIIGEWKTADCSKRRGKQKEHVVGSYIICIKIQSSIFY